VQLPARERRRIDHAADQLAHVAGWVARDRPEGVEAKVWAEQEPLLVTA
jgi:hypothetical protein